MNEMFYNANNFNQDCIGNWDTSEVIHERRTF